MHKMDFRQSYEKSLTISALIILSQNPKTYTNRLPYLCEPEPAACFFNIICQYLLLCDESFCFQSLCAENSLPGKSSYCIVGQTYEFVIVYGILTETSNRNAHSILIIYILCYLRTVVFLKVLDKVLRCAWKLKLLRNAAEVFKSLISRFLQVFAGILQKQLLYGRSVPVHGCTGR